MFNVAVFVSGRGSNLKAIIDHFSNKPGIISIVGVISDRDSCLALELARFHNIPTFILDNSNQQSSYSQLKNNLLNADTDLIVLAGFLKKIPDSFVDDFKNKIINIHPALLPSFGGKGMYGENVHKAVFAKSCKVSGPTIHFVDKVYDNGIIIAQRAVDISDTKSWDEIAVRVLQKEHELLPEVIEKFANDKIRIQGSRVVYST
ncbi:MAG: phosphoribosylglycinamide formyltransferase [Melioribacteraceae bacterium]|nr:phosphoribosylglycinamide formyltransferase [Melioribacteraceae bacterium]MCF8265062.1 phosphoribosylglycinamide formyltransferase [Melioribacteraceae bacterium]MCF8412461.1 phosphoribosylglycinamide formyltransferase [Melioribacteraceae bacterium]MCF8431919.1 phosphoribosylglycinamide formyltransferase [Melioribacteraceae bacterium]